MWSSPEALCAMAIRPEGEVASSERPKQVGLSTSQHVLSSIAQVNNIQLKSRSYGKRAH